MFIRPHGAQGVCGALLPVGRIVLVAMNEVSLQTAVIFTATNSVTSEWTVSISVFPISWTASLSGDTTL